MQYEKKLRIIFSSNCDLTALTLLLVLTWEKNLPDETPKVAVRLNFELSYFSTTL